MVNLNIGTVAGTAGVATNTLTLSDTATVTQSAALNTPNLVLLGSGGTYTLTNSGNQVGALAANTGSVSLTNSINLSIDTVPGTNGVTAGALTLTDNGTVTQSAPISTTNLALLGGGGTYTLTNAGNQVGTLAANTGAGSISLTNSVNLNIGSTGVVTGTLTLTDTGTVTQSAPISTTNLALLGGGGTYAHQYGNQVGTLAANTGTGAGSISLTDSVDLAIGSTGVVTGALTLTDTGTVTHPPDHRRESLRCSAMAAPIRSPMDNPVGALAAAPAPAPAPGASASPFRSISISARPVRHRAPDADRHRHR